MRECAFDGPHKLKDKWSEDIFIVTERPHSNMPVYRVRPESGGRERTLHRNLLLPVESIRDDTPPHPEEEESLPQEVPVTRTELADGDESIQDNSSTVVSDSEDEEVEFYQVGVPSRRSEVVDGPPVPQTVPPIPVTAPVPTSPPTPAPRRTAREHRPPEWLRSGNYETDPRIAMLFTLLDHENSDKSRVTEELLKLIVG